MDTSPAGRSRVPKCGKARPSSPALLLPCVCAHFPVCHQCRTCLNPALKRPCLTYRAADAPPTRPSLGGAEEAASSAAVVNSLLPLLFEPAVPPHGVRGFTLPIDPSTRPRKWARRWLPQQLQTVGTPCWLLRWTHDAVAAPADAPASWPGGVAARLDAAPPEEPLAPWPDTTTLGASRARTAAALAGPQLAQPAAVAGEAEAGEAGGSPGGLAEGAAGAGLPVKRKYKPAPLVMVAPGEAAPPGWLVCDQCGRAFEKPGQMTRHKATHKDRPFTCSFPGCTSSFIEKAKLSRHETMHSKPLGPSVCEVPGCGAALRTKAEEDQHKRMHNAEAYNFACPVPGCTKAYSFAYKLRLHLKTHGEGVAVPPDVLAAALSGFGPGAAGAVAGEADD